MCGRYSATMPLEMVRRLFKVRSGLNLRPRYNVAPTQSVPVVRLEEARELRLLRWGLVPHWAKDIKIGYKLINARAETVAEKPSFRDSFKKRRCLILADGYYEWQRTAKEKLPWHYTLKSGEPFGMAGLWASWTSPEKEVVESCCLITTEANALAAKVHDRMPVILEESAHEAWLDPESEPDKLKAFLKPLAASRLQTRRVSTLVNSTRNETPKVLEAFA